MIGMETTIYASIISIMLCLGLIGLAFKLKMKDRMEKQILIFLLSLLTVWSVINIFAVYGMARVIPFGMTTMKVFSFLLEVVVTDFALLWFVYVDYRIYHSHDHLWRNIKTVAVPFLVVVILNFINIFTEIMVWFDEDYVYHSTPLYLVCDLVRLIYFLGSIFYLEWHKRRDKRLQYLSVRSFIIPLMLCLVLTYFTPYVTSVLGMSIGLALMYVQNINYLSYQDTETGFFNRMYLENLRGQMKKGEYEANSALIFNLGEGDTGRMAEIISSQLPAESDTIRLGKDRIVTLAAVKDRAPLKMLADDVETNFEEAGLQVSVETVLKKKKESADEFLDRILEND